MEELLRKLRAFGRQLELEDSLPYWEGQQPELKARISEMEWNRQKKERELQNLKQPNFFQRILGKTEEEKEKRSKQIQEITAARETALWELELLTNRIAAGKQELASLAGSREAYENAKENAVLTPAQESRLMMEEISAFAPAALKIAERILEDLENSGFRIEQGQDNREMESLKNAEAAAKRLCGLLMVLPEGITTMGGYLQEPHHYISGDQQLDRLNQAQEQIRTVRNQLRLLLGE